MQAAAALAPSGNVPSIMRQAASVRQIVMHMLTVAALRVQGALAHNSRQFALDGPRGFRYTFTVRPSGGMADAAVSKTVVERRASSTLASGTIRNQRPRIRRAVFVS